MMCPWRPAWSGAPGRTLRRRGTSGSQERDEGGAPHPFGGGAAGVRLATVAGMGTMTQGAVRATRGAPPGASPAPRRRRWPLALTWALALLCGLVFAVVSVGTMVEDSEPDARIALALVVEVVCGGAALVLLGVVLLRRRLPGALALAFLGALSAMGSPAALVAVALVSARRSVRAIAAVVAACLAGSAGSVLLFSGPGTGTAAGEAWGGVVLSLGVVLVAVLLGLDLGAREERVRSLAERVELAEQIQVVRIAQGRAEERARIAREMHDSLAHSLSLVSLHAGALESRPDLDPATVRESAHAIREAARAANTELRSILQVLHEDDPGDSSRATWSDIEDLLESETRAGARIRTELPAGWSHSQVAARAFGELPAPLRHTVVRVLQESLTNARRHAPGEEVSLRLAITDGPRDLVTRGSDSWGPASWGLGSWGLGSSSGPGSSRRRLRPRPAGSGGGAGDEQGVLLEVVNALPGTATQQRGHGAGEPTEAWQGREGWKDAGVRAGAPGGGRGLPGLEERLSLVGGTVEAGVRQGRFGVTAWAPWRREGGGP